jgi:hypothetical protein
LSSIAIHFDPFGHQMYYPFAILFSVILAFSMVASTSADITDFTSWHLVEDPADANLSASVATSTASLTAGPGSVDVGNDIGYATIDGNTASTSSKGFVFDIDNDFELAMTYDLTFGSASGALGLGFGIGEEISGENSAGIAMITNNGSPFFNFAGAARTNNMNQAVRDTGLAASLSGTLFVGYDAATGNINLGAARSKEANAAEATVTYLELQDEWNDQQLIVSFFIRSDAIPILAPNGWGGGQAEAVFSNFRVLNGSATAIPEPGTWSVALALSGIAVCRRRRKTA